MTTTESAIERYFLKKTRENRSDAFKFVSPGRRGVPDRIVFRWDGGIEFVELKKPGEQLRPSQKVIKKLLEHYGQTVTVIDTKEGVDDFWKYRAFVA